MGQLQTTTTFNGQEFSALPIPGKRNEGLNPARTLYISTERNKIVILGESGDVLTSISSADGSELNVENL
ncbi:hypothetical protein DBR40_05480 [Pedobacter sp. KBW01]|nr:hypothetical protein DBR40_05480 [Pedobacter sp. KBW01]